MLAGCLAHHEVFDEGVLLLVLLDHHPHLLLERAHLLLAALQQVLVVVDLQLVRPLQVLLLGEVPHLVDVVLRLHVLVLRPEHHAAISQLVYLLCPSRRLLLQPVVPLYLGPQHLVECPAQTRSARDDKLGKYFFPQQLYFFTFGGNFFSEGALDGHCDDFCFLQLFLERLNVVAALE